MLGLAVCILALVMFDLAASKWGIDSREGIADTHTGARYRKF